MKKITLMWAVVATVIFASCTGTAKTPKASLKTQIDSVSYAFGMAQTRDLKPYLAQMGIDSTQLGDFVRGWKEGVAMAEQKNAAAYSTGIQLGMRFGDPNTFDGLNKNVFVNDTTKSFSKENFLAGFLDGVNSKYNVFDTKNAAEYADRIMDQLRNEEVTTKYKDWKAQNEKFLEENKKNDSVKVLPSGLQYKVLKEGRGPVPSDTVKVKLNYKGKLIDGTEFDASGNSPRTFSPRNVVPGFKEALTTMPLGSKWVVYIPQELGYGTREQGAIKPFSTLVFEIEPLEIVDKKKK